MFFVPALPWQAKGAINEQTNEGVFVDCWKILYNSLWIKNCVKLLMFLYEICDIFKLRESVSAIASAVVCAAKFVNSFARLQHLFDIAAKPIDVDSNFSRILFLFQFRQKCNYDHLYLSIRKYDIPSSPNGVFKKLGISPISVGMCPRTPTQT